MELILIVICAILLTAICIGCFLLGYTICDKKHIVEEEKKQKEAKAYEDTVQLTEANKQYFKDLANMMGYQGKEMNLDESEE